MSVAIVTGAAQGIGRAIAHRLARDGFAIGIADVASSRGKAESVVAEIKDAGGKATAIDCDVRKKEDVDNLVAQTVKEFGKLDVMVANAAIGPTDEFLDITPEFFENLYRINVFGVLYSYQAAARQYIKQGTPGKLIAACSVSGLETTPGQTAYCSSKFAVRSINQGAARELGKYGITANAYCPGPVNTQMWAKIVEDFGARAEKGEKSGANSTADISSPLGRISEPVDIANLVSFLAGPDSAFISGQAIQVNGGAWVS